MSERFNNGDVVRVHFAGEDRLGIIAISDGVPYVLFPQYKLGCLIDNVEEIIGNIYKDPNLLSLIR